MDYNAPDGVNAAGRQLYDTTKVPSYQIFTLSGQYTFGKIGDRASVQLYGVIDNLFDRHAETGLRTASGIDLPMTRAVSLNRPRTIGFDIRRDF